MSSSLVYLRFKAADTYEFLLIHVERLSAHFVSLRLMLARRLMGFVELIDTVAIALLVLFL